MTTTPTADTLNKLADDLGDALDRMGEHGAPENILAAGFALTGMIYRTARHPETAPMPVARMIADADGALASARLALKVMSA
ncbi:hypothetical protein [Leucobacter sp. GX0328]